MVKKRHVVVVSPRYRRQTGLCLVVPFSSVVPFEIEDHHYQIPEGKYPFFDASKQTWAKADMLTTVCFDRLDRLLLYGRWAAPSLDQSDLCGIQRAVLHALQIDIDLKLDKETILI